MSFLAFVQIGVHLWLHSTGSRNTGEFRYGDGQIHLDVSSTSVCDLTPSCGMQISELFLSHTAVADLSGLAGTPLVSLTLRNGRVLESRRRQAGGFRRMGERSRGMSAERQVQAVSKKLVELNSEFDGNVKPDIVNGVVVRIDLASDQISDISPVRACSGLTVLEAPAAGPEPGKLEDLWPLKEMRLINLNVGGTRVADLSPLDGMPISNLNIFSTLVTNLAPLRGLKLQLLDMAGAPVRDLSPLRGMPLTHLVCRHSRRIYSRRTIISSHVYHEIFLHFNWHPKNDSPTLVPAVEQVVHNLLTDRCQKSTGVFLHGIGGTPTHVHLAISIEPQVTISEMVKDLKGGSSHDANQALGAATLGWQRGYGVVSFGQRSALGTGVHCSSEGASCTIEGRRSPGARRCG